MKKIELKKYRLKDVLVLFVFSIILIPSLSFGQTNDLCSGAQAISWNTSVNGSTTLATFDNVGTCVTDNTAPGVWYTFVGDGSGAILSTCDQANFDTKISVFSGSCVSLVCVTGQDDHSNCIDYTTEVSFATNLGETYFVLVHGYGTDIGDFTLSLTSVPIPSNSLCSNAISIACGTPLNGTTIGASIDNVPYCGSDILAPNVWYTFVGNGQDATLSTCLFADYDTQIAVFSGSCEALVCEDSNDDFCNYQSELTISTTAGQTYFVLVHGYESEAGDFTLELTCNYLPSVPISNWAIYFGVFLIGIFIILSKKKILA